MNLEQSPSKQSKIKCTKKIKIKKTNSVKTEIILRMRVCRRNIFLVGKEVRQGSKTCTNSKKINNK